jgi:WD40 repeat protein
MTTVPLEQPGPAAKAGPFRRLADWLFGYDFFISYSQRDGLNYPAALEQRLESIGYKVFLDRIEYVPGIDLDQATQRRVRMSRKLIVLGRPQAFASEWVKREVEVYLSTGAAPIIIDINGSLATAAADAPLARMARERHWLRIEERVPQIDDAPSKDCIDGLTRSFKATRQETIRIRFFQGAAAVFALLAVLAIWQAIAAVLAKRDAEARRDEALAAQSRVMATLADQETDRITAIVAAPLALEALPDTAAGIARPYAPEAEAALYKALFVRRDYASLAAINSQGKNMSIGVARLSPDANRTLTYGVLLMPEDKPKTWDNRTGRLLAVKSSAASINMDAYFVKSGDAVLTMAPHGGNEAWLWSADTGKTIASYGCPAEYMGLGQLGASRDGKIALLRCGGHLIRVVDLASGATRDVLRSDQDLSFATFASDGPRIVVTQADNLIRIVKIEGGDDRPPIRAESSSKVIGILSPRGTHLAAMVGEDRKEGPLTLFDLETNKVVASPTSLINFAFLFAPERAVFSPDGQLMLAIAPNSEVRVLRTDDGSQAAVLRGHTARVLSAVFSPDGWLVITASEDRTVRIWGARSGQELAVLRGHKWPVLAADIGDDAAGTIVSSTAGNGNEARIWRAKVGRELAVGDCNAYAPKGASFSPNGKRLVIFGGPIACVWDVAAGSLVSRHDHKLAIESGSFSPDGRFVVTASDDGTAAIWFADSGLPYKALVGHEQDVVSAAFDPDGKRVLTASTDKTARLWDAVTGEPLPITLNHDRPVIHAAFSEDGKLILTVAGDNKVYLWDAATGQAKGQLPNAHRVNHAAFSPDSRHVAVASGGIGEDAGHAVAIWDLAAPDKPAATLALEGHAWRVAFSPGGRHLAVYADALIVLDVDGLAPVAVVPKDVTFGTAAFAFSRDGTRLVTASMASVSLWPHFEETQDLVKYAKENMARCLTPRERANLRLDPAPPRWCITGAGREQDKDPTTWAGTWPYDAKAWQDWLAARDRGTNAPMPKPDD